LVMRCFPEVLKLQFQTAEFSKRPKLRESM
jgi:hypothetical protein